jgi:hypothetical protein
MDFFWGMVASPRNFRDHGAVGSSKKQAFDLQPLPAAQAIRLAWRLRALLMVFWVKY